ncbi:MAG: hypothetical protein ACFCGT_26160 [Sandaracinaceae bacterium]
MGTERRREDTRRGGPARWVRLGILGLLTAGCGSAPVMMESVPDPDLKEPPWRCEAGGGACAPATAGVTPAEDAEEYAMPTCANGIGRIYVDTSASTPIVYVNCLDD